MKYKNGKDVLPDRLLKELQKYIEGELLYIPKAEAQRAAWGSSNGTRMVIQLRNEEICSLYGRGTPVVQLMDQYHLSEDSIRKILSKGAHKQVANS